VYNMATKATSELGNELQDTLSRCSGDARIVEDDGDRLRITNIPHSGTHMLPGGMSTLGVLGDYWGEWDIDYVNNGDTVMYGSKPDKDVVITRTA